MVADLYKDARVGMADSLVVILGDVEGCIDKGVEEG